MTIGSSIRLGFVAVLVGAGVLISCNSDKKEKEAADAALSGPLTDSMQIQAMLDETVARWKKRDIAVLYDQEFEYFRDKIPYDSYVNQDMMRKMEADSVVRLTAKTITIFGHDSAHVKVDAHLVGATGTEYHYPDEFTMFYLEGRWARPTMSVPAQQWQYDSLKRVADSAANAENEDTTGS